MPDKTLGSLLIRLGIDTKSLKADLFRAETSLRKQARLFQSIGDGMTKAITLPFAAAGAAGVKLASDLETNFSKIENLVGVTGDQLDRFKGQVASLSSSVGRSQAALSEALFDITSAGFRGAEGFDALRKAAELSIIGLGDTKSIAQSITGALFSFKSQALDSQEAAAVLFKTVREGKLEPEELASALASANVFASQAGIRFAELGSVLATFSRTGLTASESATGISAALKAFQTPTEQTLKVLERANLSIEDIRRSLRTRGIIETFADLQTALNKVGLRFTDVFGRRSEAVVFGQTIIENLGLARETMENMTGAVGEMNTAFENANQTSGQQFRRAVVQLQNAGIQLGNILLPAVTKVIQKVTELVGRFQALDPAVQKNIVRFGAVAAVVGPVLSIFGRVSGVLSVAAGSFARFTATVHGTGTSFKALGATLTKVSPIIGRAITVAFGPVGIALGAIALLGITVAKNWETVKEKIVDVANAFIQAYNESESFRRAVEVLDYVFDELSVRTVAALKTIKNFVIGVGALINARNLGGFKNASEIFKLSLEQIQKDFEETQAALKEKRDELARDLFIPKKLLPVDKSQVDTFFKPFEDKIKALVNQFQSAINLISGGGSGSGTTDLDPADPEPSTTKAVTRPELSILPATLDPTPLSEFNLAASQIRDTFDGIQKDLELAQFQANAFGEKFDPIEEKLNLTKEAVTNLLTQGLSPASPVIQALIEQIIALELQLDRTKAIMNSFNAAISEALSGAIANFAAQIGNAIGTAKSFGGVFKGIAVGALSAFADLLDQLGKIAITTGIALLGIKKALQSLNPAAALAAGAALIALSKIVKSRIAALGSQIPALAGGGLAFSPTLALVGDNPNAQFDPEVIAPLSKLKQLIGEASPRPIVLSARIEGRDIVLSYDSEKAQQSRIF